MPRTVVVEQFVVAKAGENATMSAFAAVAKARDIISPKKSTLIICPLAIAYSYGTYNKIGLRLSVCVCVCLSVCHHSHSRISLSIFTKFDTEV